MPQTEFLSRIMVQIVKMYDFQIYTWPYLTHIYDLGIESYREIIDMNEFAMLCAMQRCMDVIYNLSHRKKAGNSRY